MNKNKWNNLKKIAFANSDKINFTISILLFIAMYAMVIRFVWLNGTHLINSDVSAEMILSAQLNHEGISPITSNWFYSSELRVLNTQFIYRIALAISPHNWHLARTISVGMFLFLLTGSISWLMCAIGHGKYALWASLAVIAPFGRWYGWNVIYNSYYVPHIVISLVSLTLCCKTFELYPTQYRMRRNLYMAALLILGYIAGLGGVRQLMICYVPLFAASVLLSIMKRMHALSVSTVPRLSFLSGLTFALCLASCAGYLTNLKYLAKHYYFSSYADTLWSRFDLGNVLARTSDFIDLFGWQEEIPILSFSGIINALSLLFVAAIFYSAIYLINRRDTLHEKEIIAVAFSCMGFLIDLLIFSATNVYDESYWIPILPFAFLLLLVFLPKYLNGKKLAEMMLLGSYGILLFLCSYATVKRPYIDSPYIATIPTSLDLLDVSEWLNETDYTQGIATFWNSAVITELSDGKIEMWTVQKGDENLTPYRWLQSTAHVTLPKGKVFLLLPLNDELPKPFVKYNIYQDDHFVVYGFDDISQYFTLLDE